MWNVVATEKIMQTSQLYSRHPSSQKTICDFSCYPAFCFNVDQIMISWSNCHSTKNTFEPVRFFLKLSSFERRACWALLLTGLSAPPSAGVLMHTPGLGYILHDGQKTNEAHLSTSCSYKNMLLTVSCQSQSHIL